MAGFNEDGEIEFGNESTTGSEFDEMAEDEYVLDERRAIGSGVNMDIEDDNPDVDTPLILINDVPVDEVVVVEEAERKTPDEPKSEGEFVTTCGGGGMLVVDPAEDPWPRELSLFVLHDMYEVPLPEHAECLAMDALLRMCSLSFEVEEPSNVEYMSPSGRAPFIKCGPFLVAEMEPIIRHLSRKGASLSGELSDEDAQRHRELWSLVQSSLSDAEQRVCWLHPRTRRSLTEPQVASRFPWPLSSIVARQRRQRALAWLAARENGGTSAPDLELSLNLIYKQVDDVCNRLSTELGGAPFFFGENPTELEALLYGHLFLLLTVPVPVEEQTSLSQVIQEYPNLVSLVAKIDDQVFGRDLNIFLS